MSVWSDERIRSRGSSILKPFDPLLDAKRERFIESARWIADTLNREADLVEQDQRRRPNSLGILQSNAAELNALCGAIDALRTSLVGIMG